MDNRIEDLLKHPPIEGSSVPGDYDQALRYAQRCESRHYADQRKMQGAQIRLTALSEVCAAGHYPEMAAWLGEIAESLR